MTEYDWPSNEKLDRMKKGNAYRYGHVNGMIVGLVLGFILGVLFKAFLV